MRRRLHNLPGTWVCSAPALRCSASFSASRRASSEDCCEDSPLAAGAAAFAASAAFAAAAAFSAATAFEVSASSSS